MSLVGDGINWGYGSSYVLGSAVDTRIRGFPKNKLSDAVFPFVDTRIRGFPIRGLRVCVTAPHDRACDGGPSAR